MSFGRRQFLKALAWMAGASQLQTAAPVTAAPKPADSTRPASNPAHSHAFDLIVIGGGLSGLACALSAARNGVKVALVHERSMLGGNSASEVRLYPEGNDAYQPWIRESGIHEEFHLEDRARNYVRYREGLTNCTWDLVLYERAILEPNLTLFLNTHMHAVTMAAKNLIASVHCIQLGTEKTFDLAAPLFVDATGDGVLGYKAGADFRWGRESKSEYDESLAPDAPDENVMGNTLFYRAVDTGHPVPFVRPAWAYEYKEDSDLFARSHKDIEAGQWWIEVGAPYHPIRDNETIRHECLKVLLGVWDHIKNKGNHGAENYALDFVGFWPYKRESRRILGDYVLTQRDVQDPQPLEDAVANGAWGIDLHFPGGVLNTHQRPYIPPHGPNFEKYGTLPYGIPLRCLYSRNVDNLFTVGRNMSASYLAFCSSRVLSTGCVVGQAAGVAASLCTKYNKPPRAIGKDHIKECQQLILKNDGHIPGVVNEDPADLARAASASASSDLAFTMPDGQLAHPLSMARAQSFPVSTGRIDTVSVHLQSKLATPHKLQMVLRHAPQTWDFRSRDNLAAATAIVPANHDGWVDFTFNTAVDPRQLYWVYLAGPKELFWKSIPVPRGVSHATPPGCSAAQKSGPTRWEQLGTGTCMAIRLTPEQRPFTPANAITGTHRPDRWTNLWISDNQLPASLDLTWPAPQTFNTVLLTFDTNPGRREDLPLFRYPDCVKNYDLQARVNGSWKTIVSTTDNYLRRRTHRFEPTTTDALRLNVLATNGAPAARLYEIRVYNEA